MEEMCHSFVESNLFSRSNSMRLYGETALPALPAAHQYDPSCTHKPDKHSYVMSREEERQRFLEYNFAKRMFNREKDKRQTDAPRARLYAMKKWHRRQHHLCEYLTRINMPLVYSQVARNMFRWQNIDYNDAVSEGGLALMRAVRGNQTERVTKFSTYAVQTILNSVTAINRKAGVRNNRVRTVEMPEVFRDWGLDLQAPDDGKTEDIEIMLEAVNRNQAGLTPQELLVIRHRFGLCDGKPITLELVGDILGVTKERIRQIQIKALAKLREHLEPTLCK